MLFTLIPTLALIIYIDYRLIKELNKVTGTDFELLIMYFFTIYSIITIDLIILAVWILGLSWLDTL